MNWRNGTFTLIMLLSIAGCNNVDWNNHYDKTPSTIDMNVWDVIKGDTDFSKFVQYATEFHFDTLFKTRNTYTLFVPTNEAFSILPDTVPILPRTISYLISETFLQSGNIEGKRKVQTLCEKFALFDNSNGQLSMDGISLSFESPLYINGKYFKMDQVALAKPNLYEYIAASNPVLKNYIDSQDSLILDKERSRPIGFDNSGNTIYDTIATIYNKFEDKFFPVSKESRFETATLVFPKEEDYNAALTAFAQTLGGKYVDYTSIPMSWQEKVLIPYLLERGVFYNMVEPITFVTPVAPRDTVIKMKNILGDTVIIKYIPSEKTICSNGYAYNYSHFTIPDTISKGTIRVEGESLLNEIGVNKFAWYNWVTVNSSQPFQPLQEYLKDVVSQDTLIKVNFPKGYTGTYTVEFNVANLFPRKYQMIVRTSTNLGGIYNVYINDVLVKTFDYNYYVLKQGVYLSVTGKRYSTTKSGFNIFDCWVDNILTDYGQCRVKFEYVGPSKVLYNGLSIDYISFVPF